MIAPKEYLGDAVYVVVTDYAVRLTTEDGIQETNVIELEFEVLDTLISYLKRNGVLLK